MKRTLVLGLVGGIVGVGLAQLLAARDLGPTSTLGNFAIWLAAVLVIVGVGVLTRRRPPTPSDDRFSSS